MALDGNGGLNARQQAIWERVQADGEVKIAELKETYRVTEMTIRRDLEKLEAAGSVKRTFGGAIFIGRDVSIQDRNAFMLEEKLRIGRTAASVIRPGESIFIDGGSTTQQVARCLPPGMDITVVTNAINVATELTSRRIAAILTGGTLRESTSSLIGPLAAQTMAGMAFDRVFLGATGVDAAHGFSNSNVYESEIKRLAIRQSARTTIVLDRTKFGSRSLSSFASLREADCIITDAAPPAALGEALAEAGVELMLAQTDR